MPSNTNEQACKICGEWFEANTNAAKYCSDWCRKQARKRDWDSDKGRTYDQCLVCGTDLELAQRKYCPIHDGDDEKEWAKNQKGYSDYIAESDYPDYIKDEHE